VRMSSPFVSVGLAFFIAHGPHEDTGAIAIAANEIGELTDAFGIGGHHAGFIEDEHAELVAGIEQFRGGRIVRRAQGVAAHFLELADAEVLHRVRDCGAHAGMVLVIAGSFQLDDFAVEEETLDGVELHGANAEAGLVAIDDFAACLEFGDQPVEVSFFERPLCRLVQLNFLFIGLFFADGNGCGRACGSTDGLAGWIENGGDDAHGLDGGAAIVDLGADGEVGIAGTDIGLYECAPLPDVNGIGLDQPDVTVDSGTFVKPAIAGSGIDAHQQHVSAAGRGKVGEIETEGSYPPL
jgi:hypothetical protein